MKRILVFIIAIVVLFALPACGSAKSAEDAPTQSQAESSEESVSTEETSDEVTEEEASASDATGEDVTVEFEGISFVVPAGAEYSESDSSFKIVFESQKSICLIQTVDIDSDSADAMQDSDTMDLANLYAVLSLAQGYDSLSNKDTGNIEIAGVTGKYETAIAQLSGVTYNFSAVAFSSLDTLKTYMISYLATVGADVSIYEVFLESIVIAE